MSQLSGDSPVATCTADSDQAQVASSIVNPLPLKLHLQSPDLVSAQLQHFMLQRVSALKMPATAKEWTEAAAKIRAHQLEVIYHGWPKAWIDAPPKFEPFGVIQRDGYRILKFRYEIVPGFEGTALLYEPDSMMEKMPAILDVNGHGPGGKAVEQKQKRCVNQARRGILALSLEFIGYGDLDAPGNIHIHGGLLEMAGKNDAGLFYLAMRRGLDYLYDDPRVDRSRIGVTGLSGGGYQTIVLSALDPRVEAAVAVAGHSTLTTSIEHPEYHDLEQNAADFRERFDYAQMTAARAPRPTMLIFNSMDDCCFRAGIVKQGIYSDIKPFYDLYDKPDHLGWHSNLVPGTHNYGTENRAVSYRFFNSAFQMDTPEEDLPNTAREVLSADELLVGVPKDNLTILSLAQSFAKEIHHTVPADHGEEWVKSQRQLLRKVVRYDPVTVSHAWAVNAEHQKDVIGGGYRFEFSNGLSATGVLLRAADTPEDAPTTVVIADDGMSAAMVNATNDVNRGQRVLVFEPLFFGGNKPAPPAYDWQFAQVLSAMGERPLGLEAAQVTAVVRWLALGLDHGSSTLGSPDVASKEAALEKGSVPPVRIVTMGLRSETVAIVAAALDPRLFSELDAQKGIQSFSYAFTHPLRYEDALELMCLDLYKEFDLNTLSAIAAPVKVNLSAGPPKQIFWSD